MYCKNFKFSLLVQCNRSQCYIVFFFFFVFFLYRLSTICWSFSVSVCFDITLSFSEWWITLSVLLVGQYIYALSTFALHCKSQDNKHLQCTEWNRTSFQFTFQMVLMVLASFLMCHVFYFSWKKKSQTCVCHDDANKYFLQ